MRFCPDCGTGHDCETETGAQRADVEIARINADRDIKIAQYGARATVAIAETDAEHAAAHAEGVVEGVETVLEAAAGEPEPEPGAPIVVDADPEPEPEVIAEPDNAPPVVEVSAPRSSKSDGYWGPYR